MSANKTGKEDKRVLTEIPENLKYLVILLVKNFYGPEYYVLCEYIQKRVIIKEDELRDLCKIDQRQLRKFLITLKVDKIVKERLVPEEVDGKLRKVNYLFINYKAVINVAKYKIDHIRQKLEVREKDDVHKAHYRCTGANCKRQYDAMDIGKIYDPFSQEMRCWQCKASVEPDESGGPSTITRSSMAKFNEHMAGIFMLLKQMDGLRFARELLEPVIKTSLPRIEGDTIDLNTKTVASLGHRAFSRAPRSDLYGSSITVSLEDNVDVAPETKAEIPWLQQRNYAELTTTENAASVPSDDTLSADLIEKQRTRAGEESLPEKRPKKEEIDNLLQLEEEMVDTAEKQTEDGPELTEEKRSTTSRTMADDVNAFVRVKGQLVNIEEIDEEAISKMSEAEKAEYYERMQGAYEDFY
ncbi:hypothetical protein niasHT_015810 [Heterodera trifolii]|uniref:HTH TFE/IIEalpha-type domain-containing protein n=1 Tax=Heterodera trifolii TaxID=157864 RepID=A0ABD2L4Q7_9BILA